MQKTVTRTFSIDVDFQLTKAGYVWAYDTNGVQRAFREWVEQQLIDVNGG